jgi:hypothetical protein
MNRCPSRPALRLTAANMAIAISLVAGLIGLSAPAAAQLTVRPFPTAVKRGALQVTNPPDLVIDGKVERLSPGARIRDMNNMLVMSGAIVGQNLLVNYVREPQGLIHEVWILTEAEAKLPLPKAP